MTALLMWLSGLCFSLGLMAGTLCPEREGDGYAVTLAAICWPVLLTLALYWRLKNWLDGIAFDAAMREGRW